MRKLSEFAPSIAFYLLALAAQVSGYTSLPVAIALAGLATLLLLFPLGHHLRTGLFGKTLLSAAKPPETTYPDLSVANSPSVLELFNGQERPKLLELLKSEQLTSWARPMHPPDADLVRLPKEIWESNVLLFVPSSGPGRINQTYLRTKSGDVSERYDVHLNLGQVKHIWPELFHETWQRGWHELRSRRSDFWRLINRAYFSWGPQHENRDLQEVLEKAEYPSGLPLADPRQFNSWARNYRQKETDPSSTTAINFARAIYEPERSGQPSLIFGDASEFEFFDSCRRDLSKFWDEVGRQRSPTDKRKPSNILPSSLAELKMLTFLEIARVLWNPTGAAGKNGLFSLTKEVEIDVTRKTS